MELHLNIALIHNHSLNKRYFESWKRLKNHIYLFMSFLLKFYTSMCVRRWSKFSNPFEIMSSFQHLLHPILIQRTKDKLKIKSLHNVGGGIYGGYILFCKSKKLKEKVHLPGDPPIGELLRERETSKVKVKTS